jgi:hypothetical protein
LNPALVNSTIFTEDNEKTYFYLKELAFGLNLSYSVTGSEDASIRQMLNLEK